MPEKKGKLTASENFRLFGDCSTSEDEDQSHDNVKTEIMNGMRMYQERLKLRRRNQVIRPLWWKANNDDYRVKGEDASIKNKQSSNHPSNK